MIDKKSRRVVIINNIQSDTIDQAIFILKSDKSDHNNHSNTTAIANEAQMIIDSYIRQVERAKAQPNRGNVKPRQKKSSHFVSWFLSSLSALAILLILFFVAR